MPLGAVDGATSHKGTYALGTMALLAIAGTVIGTLAFVQPAATRAAWTSKALYVQMGLLSGTVIAGGVAVWARGGPGDEAAQRARTFRIGVIVLCALALPLLFGSLGACGLIPAQRMLWAATVFCAAAFVLPGIYFLLKQACDDCK